MRQILTAGLFVVAAFTTFGCDNPTAPESTTLTGTWTGTLTQAGFGVGPARLQLTHSGATIAGSARVEEPGQPQVFAIWNLTGTVTAANTAVELTLLRTTQGTSDPNAMCNALAQLVHSSGTPQRLNGTVVPTTTTINGTVCQTATLALSKE